MSIPAIEPLAGFTPFVAPTLGPTAGAMISAQ